MKRPDPKPDWRAPSEVALAALLRRSERMEKRGKGRGKADRRSRSEARADLRRDGER